MPRITVLMAVYNGRPYVAEAVDSILAQDEPDFELLIVDDGSTDGSRELIQARHDSRICLLVNDRNLGLAPSLNRGLAHAQAALVARQDADDISEPTRLSRQAAFLDAHPDVALVGSAYREIDAFGVETGRVQLPCEPETIRWMSWFYCPFVHSAVMFRRSVIPDAVGFYEESLRYSMDYELWRRVARRFPVANLDEPLVRLRANPKSMTATYGEATGEGERLRIAGVAERLGWTPRDDAAAASRYSAMLGLMMGVNPRPAAELVLAVDDLAHLMRAFARDEGMDADRLRSFDARLRSQLASSIANTLALHRGAYSAPDFARLAWLACRLRPSIVLERRGFRPLMSKLLGRRGTRPAEAPDGTGAPRA